jgi:NADH dehydrogenase (ubiquinone) Fe-S protein 1
LEVGISPKKCESTPKVIFLLGADNHLNPKDFPENAFVIYLGSQGDEGAHFADLVLPGATYHEKNSTFVSTEGRVQSTKLVAHPPGMARFEWEVLRAISEECGQTLPYDTEEELKFRIAELAPHLLKYDYIEPTLFGKIAA